MAIHSRKFNSRLMRSWLALGVLLLAAGSTYAGSTVLGTSGWMASWADQLDPQIQIATSSQGNDSVLITKQVDFFSNQPITILFQQIQSNALPHIAITTEQLTNSTNSSWIGYRQTVVGDATFDPATTALNTPGGFSVNPFTTATISQNNTLFDVSGAVIPNTGIDNVWRPGLVSGELWMTTTPGNGIDTLGAFELIEEPIPGGAQVIPVPMALALGLVGVGMSAVAARRRIRG